MGYDKQYNSLDHSAPEVVELQNAPEVVSSAGQPLARQESDLLPETYEVRAHRKQEHEAYGAYGTHSSGGDNALPIYTSHDTPGSDSYLNAEGGNAQYGRREKSSERRYCGLRKKVLIWIIVGIVLLILLAAILGGVLGTVLPDKKSGGKPLQAISMTGLATVKTSDGTVYQYFQNPDRSIVENSYSGGSWSLDAGSENSDDNLVTRAAGAGSPFAAVSYSYNGDEVRQIFYITSTGELHTMNRTDGRSWGDSTLITSDAASSGSIGLTACASEVGLEGIRVYYASQKNWIQEVAGYFNGSAWLQKHGFGGTDATSGAACSVHISQAHQYLLLYVRNPAKGVVDQWYRDFASGDPHYYEGTISWKNHTIAAGSDIAVCNDGADTEYVFYQLEGGVITRGVTNPFKTIYQTFSNMQGAKPGSKLAAAYVEDGAMVMFQNRSSDSTMWAVDVSRDGYPIFDMAVS